MPSSLRWNKATLQQHKAELHSNLGKEVSNNNLKLQGDFNYAECNYQNWSLSRTLGLRPYLLQKMPWNFQHPSPHFLWVTHWASKYTLREASPVWIVKNDGTSGQGAEEKLLFLTDQSFLFAHNAKGFLLERETKSFWVCDTVQSHLTRAAIGLQCEPWVADRAGWLCSLNWVISTLKQKWTISWPSLRKLGWIHLNI